MNSVQRVLVLVLLLNLAVALAKYAYGTVAGLASVQADGVHSLFDSAGNVVGILGVLIASRPADESHPYGHGKFETYASAAIGVLLVVAAVEVGTGAVERLVSGATDVQAEPLSFGVMLATLAVNVGVALFERRQARELGSAVLAADAGHTMSDVLVSVGVIVGLGFVALGFPQADALVALGVMLAIAHAAWEVLRSAAAVLSDHSAIDADELHAAAFAVEGVRGVHRARSRAMSGEVFCDVHVLVDPGMTVRDSHELATQVEQAVMARFPQVVEVLVHIEPEDDPVEGL
ncbi:cation transporter [Eggerthellaceae bacterium zg-1084]|uniref:Cation transporter n=2 Tax=Berryella wangjianweii TaxID=2734634 RepID=A0A6M8IWN1_9ACTN|nr:cation diffusion facilitator family transporter [Berryella wangjianweii]NPD30446.1 cation transporter [Berryella wangjianweii]NPD32749.1 cation transporter [Eggerthellaceae bacterium zg-997]QKF07115.1 cation transporter [Berryella wangjianweii]